MLHALGVEAKALREEFPPDTKDPALFLKLRGRDIVFVATDLRQLRRECEARELKANGQTAVYFGNFYSNLLLWDQAVWLVTRWPKIAGFVEGSTRGTIAEIQQNGRANPISL
jgi:hypothetical protein